MDIADNETWAMQDRMEDLALGQSAGYTIKIKDSVAKSIDSVDSVDSPGAYRYPSLGAMDFDGTHDAALFDDFLAFVGLPDNVLFSETPSEYIISSSREWRRDQFELLTNYTR